MSVPIYTSAASLSVLIVWFSVLKRKKFGSSIGDSTKLLYHSTTRLDTICITFLTYSLFNKKIPFFYYFI